MQIITKKYKVYSFDELSEKAKKHAISQEIQFYLEIDYEHLPECVQKACDKAKKMQTPWFAGSYIYDDCKDFLIDTIKSNEYQFLESGELFS